MMAEKESTTRGGTGGKGGREFPLQHTASVINQRLGLYLSAEQQKGLATGLLIGAALGGAILAWSVAEALSER
jgi:hypothetical protein